MIALIAFFWVRGKALISIFFSYWEGLLFIASNFLCFNSRFEQVGFSMGLFHKILRELLAGEARCLFIGAKEEREIMRPGIDKEGTNHQGPQCGYLCGITNKSLGFQRPPDQFSGKDTSQNHQLPQCPICSKIVRLRREDQSPNSQPLIFFTTPIVKIPDPTTRIGLFIA